MLLALLASVAPVAVCTARAAAADYDIPGGHFFTQTSPAGAGDGHGYSVTDSDGIPFWSVYQSEGGLLQMGFPLSRRFVWRGLVTQVMQKATFQWVPATGRVEFVNVLDELNLKGMDAWLEERLVPRHLMLDDGRLPWDEMARARMDLFGDAAELRAAFEQSPDPLLHYGLPTSQVVDFGVMVTIRLQRAALQLWKVETAFAKPGQVVVANAGELAVEAGLFPADALTPEAPAGGAAPTGDPVIDRINYWRSLAGLPAIAKSDELMRAAQSHADYYVRNAADPSTPTPSAHTETPGLPGFTGESIYDRAKAAGYPGNWIDENVSFSADAVENVDLFAATVFHRYPLLHPSTVAIGYGVGDSGGHEITVINAGLDPDFTPPVELPSVYPGPGQTDVPSLWYAYESPDPVPGLERPVGSPITISFLIRQRVEWGPVTVTSERGEPVQVVVAPSEWRRSLGVTPVVPLAVGTRYTVSVNGIVDGQGFNKTWAFTTAP